MKRLSEGQTKLLKVECFSRYLNLDVKAECYQGNLSIQFIRDVQEGKYPVIEGVVAKGEDFSVKIKTKSYFDKLFNNFGENWKNYAE